MIVIFELRNGRFVPAGINLKPRDSLLDDLPEPDADLESHVILSNATAPTHPNLPAFLPDGDQRRDHLQGFLNVADITDHQECAPDYALTAHA
jgi:hypothetical protein